MDADKEGIVTQEMKLDTISRLLDMDDTLSKLKNRYPTSTNDYECIDDISKQINTAIEELIKSYDE